MYNRSRLRDRKKDRRNRRSSSPLSLWAFFQRDDGCFLCLTKNPPSGSPVDPAGTSFFFAYRCGFEKSFFPRCRGGVRNASHPDIAPLIVALGLSLFCQCRRHRKEHNSYCNRPEYRKPTFHGFPPCHGPSLLCLRSVNESNGEANDPCAFYEPDPVIVAMSCWKVCSCSTIASP